VTAGVEKPITGVGRIGLNGTRPNCRFPFLAVARVADHRLVQKSLSVSANVVVSQMSLEVIKLGGNTWYISSRKM
jgi:hypothetical protein